jgi:chromosome segregation ATPase
MALKISRITKIASKSKSEQRKLADDVNSEKTRLEETTEELKKVDKLVLAQHTALNTKNKEIRLLDNTIVEKADKVREFNFLIVDKKNELQSLSKEKEDSDAKMSLILKNSQDRVDTDINVKEEELALLVKMITAAEDTSLLADSELKKNEIELENTGEEIVKKSEELKSIEVNVVKDVDILAGKAKDIEELKDKIKNSVEEWNSLKEDIKKTEVENLKKSAELDALNEAVKLVNEKKEKTEAEIAANENRLLNIARRETRMNEMKDKLKELYAKAGIKVEIE